MRRKSCGYTLVEIIVVVSVVLVLLGILVPALAGSVDKRAELKSLANARALAVVLTMYAQDHGDRFFSYSGVPVFQHFSLSYTWANHIGDRYISPENSAMLRSGATRDGPKNTTKYNEYQYSCSFLASPDYFTSAGRLGGDAVQSQLRGVLLSDITVPSGKAMLQDWAIYELSRKTRSDISGTWQSGPAWIGAFADTSASRHVALASGYPNGDGIGGIGIHHESLPDGMHTISGVHGKDK